MNASMKMLKAFCCFSVVVIYSLCSVSSVIAQTEVLSEEFKKKSKLYDHYVKDPDRNSRQYTALEQLRTSWNISSTPLILIRELLFGDVLPPNGTFKKNGKKNSDYFLGHLVGREGTMVFKVKVGKNVSPHLHLQLAAAHAADKREPRFHNDEDFLEIWVQDKKADVGTLVDRFEGGHPAGKLTSPLSGSLSTNFSEFSYDLSAHLPKKSTKFNIIIVSSTGFREYVGVDDVVVTASAANDDDQCPSDPNKTEPGACGCGVAETDSDNDDTPDCLDDCSADPAKVDPGACGCGIADTDSDFDEIADCIDACPADPLKSEAGVCGCGVVDDDSDGDGTPDCVDGCPNDADKGEAGSCGCGEVDADSDGDGVADCVDGCPSDADKSEAGICGCGVADSDADGDGSLDCQDNCPADAEKTEPLSCGCGVAETDADNDGTPDCVDGCPNGSGKTEPGICGCNTPDTDSDNDGTPDCLDACPTDSNKIAAGACGCGVADTDADSDGTPDCNDACASDPAKTEAGICGCGVADTDADNDGTPDCNDACASDPAKTEAGICGCGVADTDADSDGTPDCNDACSSDPAKTEAGICGCGVADADADSDGTPDCNDACASDPAKTEAGICGCGIPDSTPSCLLNGDFQTGDFTNWTPDSSSGGTISIVLHGAPGNFAGQLVTGSPVSLTTRANTPAESYYLLFDTKFSSTTGDLVVSISGSELGSIGAPTSIDSEFHTQSFLVTEEELQNLSMANIRFLFDGPTGSSLFIDNVVVIPATAGESCLYGGEDAIGPDPALTNGRNASSCSAGLSDDGTFNGNWYSENIGAPGIGYISDGQGLLTSLRTVVTVIQRQPEFKIDWSRIFWAVHVWDLPTYLAKGTPILSVSLGATPSNWNSFKINASGETVPDAPTFGDPGNNAGKFAYEMIFDLSDEAEFARPLPAGDYVLVFTGEGSVTYGEPGMLTNGVGAGPTPYYSATGRDVPIEPGLVYPRLLSDPNWRWALNVTEERLNCE